MQGAGYFRSVSEAVAASRPADTLVLRPGAQAVPVTQVRVTRRSGRSLIVTKIYFPEAASSLNGVKTLSLVFKSFPEHATRLDCLVDERDESTNLPPMTTKTRLSPLRYVRHFFGNMNCDLL